MSNMFSIIEGNVFQLDIDGNPVAKDQFLNQLYKDDRKIFDGEAFRYEYFTPLHLGQNYRFLSITPANSTNGIYTQIHLRVKIHTMNEAQYRVYLNPTYSATGTQGVSSKNPHYQAIGKPSSAFSLYRNPTITTTGSVIRQQRWGNGTKLGGSSDPNEFTILSPAQTLMYQIDSYANGNYLYMEFNWQDWHRVDPTF